MDDDMTIRAHQNGAAISDPTRQMTLDDAQSVLGLLRENQRIVTKDAMASAINTFEKEVKMLHVGQEMLTLGGAFKKASTPLRQYLQLHYSTGVAANTAAATAGVTAPRTPNPQGQDMHKAQMQSQINKLKAAAAGRGGRGRGRGQQHYYQQQQYYGPPPPYYGTPHPPPTPNGKGKGKGNPAGRGGGRGAGAKDTHGKGSVGPSGLTRHVGGNPNGPTCPDWVAGTCHTRRIHCDRKHGY